MVVTDPLRGVDCSTKAKELHGVRDVTDPLRRKVEPHQNDLMNYELGLPTPCGEWGAATDSASMKTGLNVTDPLRGVDCSFHMQKFILLNTVTDPLRGVDCSFL